MQMGTNNNKPVLDVHEIPNPVQWVSLSIQHLFAMFGATVLVPFLVGLSPAVALVSSGVGTLAYLLITRGQIPAYLGSSFAFIVPLQAAHKTDTVGEALVACFIAGLFYGVLSLFIQRAGIRWLMNILPPVVIGPIIMVIGLSLSGTAVDMAMYETLESGEKVYSTAYITIALLTLGMTIFSSVFFKGFFGLIPVLIGIVFGYICSAVAGIIDYEPIKEAGWFEVPGFIFPFADYDPVLSGGVIVTMLLVSIVTLSEHIGHQMVLSKVVGRNFLEKPGLHKSILGDGAGIMIGSMIGGPPLTSYGENIGVLTMTRAYSVYIIGGAAGTAIIFGFIGKISAVISSIPSAVMGGVSILLFGIIASSGLRMMIDSRIDFNEKRNLMIASVILVIGIGGAFVRLSDTVQLSGMALAAVIGILLNLVLPGRQKETADPFEETKTVQ